ncbi:MAG: cation transporter [Deltaproteobacteria bacterium]|nr:MAG: cation transporter [Deltaproteobacteria bacterium]
MSDAHQHGHHHPHIQAPARGPQREGEARRLRLTLLVALVAMLVEAAGGFFTHSLALLSDAGHMLADVGAIGLSVFALHIGSRPADAKRTYGYYRLEILAALLNGAALIAIAIVIGVEAFQRLRNPHPIHAGAVALLACGGIALNAIGLWLTHSQESSMNLRSTFLHLAGDLLNSVGVLAAAGIIALTRHLEADPIISFVIAGTIVWSAVRLCREAVDVLLEGFPAHLDFQKVNEALGQVPGVNAVHDLHVWTITSGLVALSCHLVVVCDGPKCRSHDEILIDAKALLRDRFGIEHTTIQFESESYRHEEIVH